MNIQLYLDRIQIKSQEIRDFDFLSALQRQHLLHIYFENIDIIAEKPISLDWKQQFEKIVMRHRGGVCFELNGLFHQLLQELGYHVYMVAATVYTPEGWSSVEHSHLINLVQLEGSTYLVDVGFGGKTPRKPVPLHGEEVADLDGSYRIRSEKDPTVLILEKREKDQWEPLYRFEDESREIKDFIEPCRFVETSPHSHFTHGYFLSRATDQGRITLTDRSLTIIKNGEKQKREIKEGELKKLIQTYFHISSDQLDLNE